jgi:3-dehydroquinate dehydratase-1
MKKPLLHIGSVPLEQKYPKIIAVLDSYFSADELKRIYSDGASIAEIRFDLLPGSIDEKLEYAKLIRLSAPFAILGTLRETAENKTIRNSLIEQIVPFVDGIDEEVSYPSVAKNLSVAKGKLKVASHHDFEKTPDDAEMGEWVEKCNTVGADVVKLAFQVASIDDLNRIRQFAQLIKEPAIVIAMGEHGVESRKKPESFASIATYAFTGKQAIAPGQLSVAKISEYLKACK